MSHTSVLAPTESYFVPALVEASGDHARDSYLEFLVVGIQNSHTRRAYARSCCEFLAWCQEAGIQSLAQLRPLHVTAWIDLQQRERSAASVKQKLAAVRRLLGWMVLAEVVTINSAAFVSSPRHVKSTAKTQALEPEEVRQLLDSIDDSTPAGLRDRALIALMTYTFARIGVALAMKVEDVYTQDGRLWVRLHEKGGRDYATPCHHKLQEVLSAYIAGAGIAADRWGPLFRTIGRGSASLTRNSLPQSNAYAMIQRRAQVAGIKGKIGNHTFRATGITAYLNSGGALENAAALAHHSSTRTTQRYDRERNTTTLDDIERIKI